MDPELGVQLSAVSENSENGVTKSSTRTLKMRGSVMSFHDVSYTVNIEKMCCGSCRSAEPKAILHEMSGILRPGLNAILGSTGSGKSTLLDVLANRKDPECVSGNVYLDGKPVPSNFQYLSGYVVQNDLFVATVTVREALWFCANLRLPNSVSREEKAEKIEQILKDLGLSRCADTKIGNDLIRGISGGEKKRTSIAAELILEPRILFLDEPTTGLDAATAWSVVSLLKRLADQGHTIVCSIHQPRYSIYKLFDSLILLSNGHMVYQGPAAGALDYFEGLGYVCEAHDNPADFYLDVLNGAHERAANGQSALNESSDNIADPTKILKQSFIESNIKKQLDSELQRIDAPCATLESSESKKMYANGFWRQMKILLGRTGKNMIRDPQMLLGNSIVTLIMAIVFGLIFLQSPHTPDKGVQNRLGVLFFLCANLLFGSSMLIDAFIKERAIFVHEHVSGYYSISSYYLSKVVADLVPLRTLPPIVYTLTTYWMVGLNAEAGSVFIFLLTSLLLGYVSVGIGLLYSASFSQSVGQLVILLTFVFTLLFSGLLVNLGKMGDWLSWLQYFSVCRYAIVAFSIAEFRGVNFTQCANRSEDIATAGAFGSVADEHAHTIGVNGTVCKVLQGETFLKETLSIGESGKSIDDWDLWQNIVALGCIIIGVYTLTYIQLLRKKMYS